MSRLDLLILTDLHYAPDDASASPLPERRSSFGLELAVRAVHDALLAGRPDAIVLLGDCLESPADAENRFRQLHAALARFEIPIVALPGNHDNAPDALTRVFGCAPGVQTIGAYSLVSFFDAWDAADVCTRPAAQMPALRQAAAQGQPIIALQHNPVLPRLTGPYPYTITDAEAIADAYADAGVCVSLSGHYHAGLPAHDHRGVAFVVCPALCESPFRYTRLRLASRSIASLETVALAPAELTGLMDCHVHSQFAYCAEDVTAADALERKKLLGLGAIGLCEHADQLYFPRDGYWKRTDAHRIDAVRRSVAEGHSRHARYREFIRPLRGENVFLGLEVDPEDSGRGLAVLDEDLAGWDYLIGSVHYLCKGSDLELSPADVESRFMRATEQVVRGGVDVLAHPFRYFPRTQRVAPRHLFKPVAQLLASHGVAAEINYHTDDPPADFFAACLEHGVKLALGSDSHTLADVGALRPHLAMLRQLGANRLDEILWRPKRAVR